MQSTYRRKREEEGSLFSPGKMEAGTQRNAGFKPLSDRFSENHLCYATG